MQLNYKRILSSFILLGIIFAPAPSWEQEIFLKDDFESKTLSSIWTTEKLSKNAIRHITSPTRTGRGAIEIRVFPNAKTEIGGDGQLTERAELREAPDVRLAMGLESWYGFSF